MPEPVRITVELQHTLGLSLTACGEAVNNAVATYAVKHRLLLEEVAAYWQGFAWSANGQRLATYTVCQRPLSPHERHNIRKTAKDKAARADAK